ncbi:transcriptional regulator, BadM/Rrf2 family [Frankia casuarinae]|jgi:Rrf2 family protein|uniref:Transcriptional regulator, BadM/Rrf2 family n=1 Tax=Frankia casuarinae (strain DSM 45818 / CECT 9043 / HFP020203 / CcI3) TaxID=106370 RepID=Q2J722_FRACC|nr:MULTISPECIES: Rrf2 family transcriptional regulator [Frankia]ABD12920.1 transcriptional regulator, BadM/Rrf2 family [Frankia casuarinae]ETA03523.1 transcriptional regulator, BadM/Rrf2 family [Frankia sp. CcI6]EYT93526.1 transcriptional regulator, BadM/Rrf2 family [Frankia casuarinae]KDA43711.1 transcriptional regulator, BadM/Rrf2 family [Frankia sp. BMG5.23]KFB05220.1 transcriptional regulator, BadM/Rrf2 family [Frankia sp. Allo2]
MQISARADYALRALLTLAASNGRLVKGEALAAAQDLPLRFLENILTDLRRAGLVQSRRGADGGYQLSLPPERITIATVIRATDGPLASVRGRRPEDTNYDGAAKHLQDVWIAVRVNLRRVLEAVTLADVASGQLPDIVTTLGCDPDAWVTR